MGALQAVLSFLFLHLLVADDISQLHNEDSVESSKYSRAMNTLDLDTDIGIIERSKRQASANFDEEYFVTQCGYDKVQQPDGPSIQVLGVSLLYPGATLTAAKLVHLLVRFMPRPLFLKIVEKNTIGLFPTTQLPASLFTDFIENMPSICGGRCGIQRQGLEQVDCNQWCTTAEYPYQSLPYSINYLWAYGNFSTLFVPETNVICDGFNPVGSENLLIREFGFMMITRILDYQTVVEIRDAYTSAMGNATWQSMKNEYEYFILGTLAWFNGISSSNELKGMACLNIYGNGVRLCSDEFGQRQYIKQNDMKLYKILNYVYNNNREYVNADTSICEW